jgi:hypothetical protein
VFSDSCIKQCKKLWLFVNWNIEKIRFLLEALTLSVGTKYGLYEPRHRTHDIYNIGLDRKVKIGVILKDLEVDWFYLAQTGRV